MIEKKIIKKYNKTRALSKRKLVCHAPAKSLRFSQSGNVIACCYNRKYSIGRFPADNLHDIWFGEKRKLLANSISKNDFSLGCHNCRNKIINENFNSVGAKLYDYLPESSFGFPVMFDFEISNVCNLECIMCNGENSSLIRKNIEKLPPLTSPYNEEFVEQIKEFLPYLTEARFVGGEPFLMEINYKIWDEIIKINPDIEISVLTNGTILDDRIKKILKEGKFKISVSIDSLDKQNYEKIRKNADFDTVMNNIKYFSLHAKENNYTFNINVCPIRQNRKELPDIVDYCNENNYGLIFHTIIFPPNTSLWNLRKDELEDIIRFLKSKKIKTKTKLAKYNNAAYLGLIKQLENWKEKALDKKNEDILSNMPEDKLKKTLYDKINKISDNKKYINAIELALQELDENAMRHKALITLNKMSVKDIIAEIEISSTEMMTERIKAAANF